MITMMRAAVVLLLSTLIVPAALAQEAGGQINVVVYSFEELPRVIGAGDQVKVTDDAGRARRGRVESLSGNEIVVSWRQELFGYFRPRATRAFAANAVESIDLVDSTWNGGAIGAAVGAGLLALSIREARSTGPSDPNLKPFSLIVLGLAAFGTSVGIGRTIDSRINELVYVRQPRTARISIAPWLTRSNRGAVFQVQF